MISRLAMQTRNLSALIALSACLSLSDARADGKKPPVGDGVPPVHAAPAKPDPAAVSPLAGFVGTFDAEVEADSKTYKMVFTGEWQARKKFVRLGCVRDDKRESFAVYGWDGETFRSWHYDDEGGVAQISGTWNAMKRELTQRHDGGPDVVTTGKWVDDDTFVWTMTKPVGDERVTVQQGKLLRRKS